MHSHEQHKDSGPHGAYTLIAVDRHKSVLHQITIHSMKKTIARKGKRAKGEE